jgi:hypothetical protein
MKIIAMLFAAMAFVGCAQITIKDLEEVGIRRAWILGGDYQKIGFCLVQWLEREAPGSRLSPGIRFGIHYRNFPTENRVEISQRPGGNAIFWVLTLTPFKSGTTSADILVEPYSPGWKLKALRPGLKKCSKSITSR